MKVNIRLLAHLKQYAPAGDGSFQLELGPDATVGKLQEHLNIPPALKRLTLVNGGHADENSVLAEGDAVTIFQPAGGG